MKNPIEHERMRFKTMTQEQLLTRLRKITHPEKLESFIVMAREYGYSLLIKIATEKLNQSGGQTVVPPRPFLNPVKTKQIKVVFVNPPKKDLKPNQPKQTTGKRSLIF